MLQHLITDEANAVARGGLAKVEDFFIKKVKVKALDFKPFVSYADRLKEIHERRNVFVHRNGVIDKKYLDCISTADARARDFALGKRLRIPRRYILEAIDVVRLAGFLLIQICWRKWATSERKQADLALRNFT